MLNKIRMWVARKMGWNTTPYSKEAWERWARYTSNRDRAIREEDQDN